MIAVKYSDLICPWCFIGKKRLEKGIALVGGREVIVRWHPFQLNPDMPLGGRIAGPTVSVKFGSWERSQSMDAEVRRPVAARGSPSTTTRWPATPNTLDSHRVVWLAGERGVQDAVVEALFERTSPTAETCPTGQSGSRRRRSDRKCRAAFAWRHKC